MFMFNIAKEMSCYEVSGSTLLLILSSKDPDETPHDKTGKLGVLCINAVLISLGI